LAIPEIDSIQAHGFFVKLLHLVYLASVSDSALILGIQPSIRMLKLGRSDASIRFMQLGWPWFYCDVLKQKKFNWIQNGSSVLHLQRLPLNKGSTNRIATQRTLVNLRDHSSVAGEELLSDCFCWSSWWEL
jgi:hypothetical protein